jgi:hypothetical protein
MKLPTLIAGLVILVHIPTNAAEPILNRLIDYTAFEKIVVQSRFQREANRLTEAEFLKAIESGDYVLLDARSKANFDKRHIKGAVNLPFTEFSEQSLAAIISGKKTRILIYCNNNFEGSPIAMFSKSPAASLNLSTQASLRAYGYKKIFELGPLLDVKTTKLPFSGTEIETKADLKR